MGPRATHANCLYLAKGWIISHGDPLHLQAASYYGNLEVVQVLVAMGADLDTADPEGETALMLAVEEVGG